MHHFHNTGRRERSGERAEPGHRDRVDTDRVVAGRHLYQAELGAIGALAQEFRVETDMRARGEAPSEIGDGVGSVGDVLQQDEG